MQSLLEGDSQVCTTWRVADVVGNFTRESFDCIVLLCSSIASGLMSFLLGTEYRTVMSLLLPFGAVWQKETFAANPELLVFIFGNHVNLLEYPHSFLHCKLSLFFAFISFFLFRCKRHRVCRDQEDGSDSFEDRLSLSCFTGTSLRVARPFSRDFGKLALCQGDLQDYFFIFEALNSSAGLYDQEWSFSFGFIM